MRAKVACLRHDQGDAAAAPAATSLLELTLRHLEHGRVVAVALGGLPGTGKSTLAAGIADAKGWSVLRSDEVRKDLVGLGRAERAGSAFGEGIYRPELTEATYRTLLDRARQALSLGEPVVLDASWMDARWRGAAADLARETTSDFVELRCAAPADLAATRMARRAQAGGDPSDVTPAVALAMASVADAWPSAVDIDTSGTPERSLEQVLAVLAGSTGG